MKKRLFILDTNVLMHDPTAIFRFEEHAVYLPMVVLEELDAGKKGMSEVARNVRQVSRFLDELMQNIDGNIEEGIPLPTTNKATKAGRLFFQTQLLPNEPLPSTLPGNTPDNSILSLAMALQKADLQCEVTLVSKDINLRIKAHVLAIKTEDYTNDKVLDDVDLLYTGELALADNFWETHSKSLASWQEQGRTYYKVTGDDVPDWYPNQFIYNPAEHDKFEAIVRKVDDNQATIELVRDFTEARHNVWGINARNREQNFALNLLMDSEVDFVSLLGTAGTGKTLLALAAGLAQTLDQQRYREIIITRVTIPVGEDIGFLPGTEEEKMTPWMGALMDNLEVLNPTQGGEWGRAATEDLLNTRIKIRSLNFMRGRTFLNRFIILDEAQNLTSKQMKTFITRAGPGTKIVCLGNIAQIDTPYLSETTSGLTYVVDRFKPWQHGGHITLQRGERSRLADFASQVL
ncbi:AAA family ATPase [Beggiatoa leptomitoformis]|uniref:AAA family ATPase n=2 Tax=Beggiatoa leptomitoformis TaxID=288004 RepID=A0A2N9YIH3_9GAMM|nr:PhoH family protein [Beggiatoa leptomitoformis]ALG67451.1 AAA family ATPase [Beggiatoa leptomitoformis]AUI70332.1 AAA family ATPase [Beggiatoa leptomitoformis]